MRGIYETYRVIKKSLFTWWLQYKKHEKIFQTVSITYHHNLVRLRVNRWRVSLYWSRYSITQFGVSINVWRPAETLWTLLVTVSIVIIRCTETFWSPCSRRDDEGPTQRRSGKHFNVGGEWGVERNTVTGICMLELLMWLLWTEGREGGETWWLNFDLLVSVKLVSWIVSSWSVHQSRHI
jgi:hypothetical protein